MAALRSYLPAIVLFLVLAVFVGLWARDPPPAPANDRSRAEPVEDLLLSGCLDALDAAIVAAKNDVTFFNVTLLAVRTRLLHLSSTGRCQRFTSRAIRLQNDLEKSVRRRKWNQKIKDEFRAKVRELRNQFTGP